MKNKIILITGSSRGIGAATARLAHSRGAKVTVHGRSDSEELRKIADELNAFKIFGIVISPSRFSRINPPGTSCSKFLIK